MKAVVGEICPYCEKFIRSPGHYLHFPKCAEEHDFKIKYHEINEVNINEININEKEINEGKIHKTPIIRMVKALINKNGNKIKNRMQNIENKIEYMENKKIFEEKLKMTKLSSNINIKQGVYFIRCNDYVKIGYSHKISNRFSALQSANPYPLELLLCIEGTIQLESFLHDKFREHRIKGEWFILSFEIESFMEELKKNEQYNSSEKPILYS